MSLAHENPEDIPQLCKNCRWLKTCDGVTPNKYTSTKLYSEFDQYENLIHCDGYVSGYWQGNIVEALKFALSALHSLCDEPEKMHPAQLMILNATIVELAYHIQELEHNG
jgi:hypothetical protein